MLARTCVYVYVGRVAVVAVVAVAAAAAAAAAVVVVLVVVAGAVVVVVVVNNNNNNNKQTNKQTNKRPQTTGIDGDRANALHALPPRQWREGGAFKRLKSRTTTRRRRI